MTAKPPKPFRIVTGKQSGPQQPSRALGEHGQRLWTAITSEFQVTDSAGVELLTSACQSLDRAERCREQVDKDGETILTKTGVIRDHPALRHETQNRALCISILQKLGLDNEPLKAIGRPNRSVHWEGNDS